MKKQLTWTIKFETMTEQIKTAKFKAENYNKAIDELCQNVSVANIISVHDSKRVQWL